MILIGNTLVSEDLIERYFACDLNECKGQCCIDGDAGAPLEKEEDEEILKHLDKVKPLLTPGGRKAIEEEGTSYYDRDGDLVTTLIEGKNCAYTVYGDCGVCLCALEKGYREGNLPQLKPSSCHLYPVRLKKIGDLTAVNLHRWKICGGAEKNGRKLGIRAYEFLEKPLKRKFGEKWYEELSEVAREWLKNREK